MLDSEAPIFVRAVGGSLALAQDHRAAVRGGICGALLRTPQDQATREPEVLCGVFVRSPAGDSTAGDETGAERECLEPKGSRSDTVCYWSDGERGAGACEGDALQLSTTKGSL